MGLKKAYVVTSGNGEIEGVYSSETKANEAADNENSIQAFTLNEPAEVTVFEVNISKNGVDVKDCDYQIATGSLLDKCLMESKTHFINDHKSVTGYILTTTKNRAVRKTYRHLRWLRKTGHTIDV